MTVTAAHFHKINLGSALQREEMKVDKLNISDKLDLWPVYRLHKIQSKAWLNKHLNNGFVFHCFLRHCCLFLFRFSILLT